MTLYGFRAYGIPPYRPRNNNNRLLCAVAVIIVLLLVALAVILPVTLVYLPQQGKIEIIPPDAHLCFFLLPYTKKLLIIEMFLCENLA